MEFEWDEAKDAANRAKHGVGFDVARELRWEDALPEKDVRAEYGEDRFIIYAYRATRLYACVFTLRQDRIRIISLRKANKREERDCGR